MNYNDWYSIQLLRKYCSCYIRGSGRSLWADNWLQRTRPSRQIDRKTKGRLCKEFCSRVFKISGKENCLYCYMSILPLWRGRGRGGKGGGRGERAR